MRVIYGVLGGTVDARSPVELPSIGVGLRHIRKPICAYPRFPDVGEANDPRPLFDNR